MILGIFKNQADMCARLGVTRSCFNHWLKHGLPAKQALEIESMTNGAVKAADIAGNKFEKAIKA